MRAKVFNLFSLIAIAVCIISCQKDYEPGIVDPPTTNPPSIVNDSTYLNRIYYVDSISGIKDTTELIAYFYDSQKRVITLRDSAIDLSGNWAQVSFTNYFYNGADTLPFKAVRYQFEAGIISNSDSKDTSTSFYRYDATGRTIYDSTYFSRSATMPVPYVEKFLEIHNYQYVGNKIYAENREENIEPSVSVGYHRDTAQLDANSNVISSKRYAENVGVWEPYIISTFTYDDHPSPFAKLSNFRTIGVLPFGETFITEMQGKNNRLRAFETYNSNSPFEQDFTGKYKYNVNGYPSSIKESDSNIPTDASIILFSYRSF